MQTADTMTMDLSLVRMDDLEQGYRDFPLRYNRTFHMTSCESLLDAGGGIVVAPTGSGKTTLALYISHALLARGISTWFTTPTNKLNQQHVTYLKTHSTMPQRIHGLSADGERQIPTDPCIIVSTAHLFRILAAESWEGAVIIDEVHHVTQSAPYDLLKTRQGLTFGLTASPGVSRERIRQLLSLLGTKCVAYHMYEADIELRDVACPLSAGYSEVFHEFATVVTRYRTKLCQSVPALRFSDPLTLLKQESTTHRHQLSRLFSLEWALDLLGAHDISLFNKYVAGNKVKLFLQKYVPKVLTLQGAHPKLLMTKQLVEGFRNDGLRGIIFTTFKQVQERLRQLIPGIGVLRGGPGKQSKVDLAAFREGALDWVVATSVAQEGLDIPSAHVVIAYDVPKETQRYIQRRGRVGRSGRGILVSLYSLKSEELRLEKIRKGENRMYDNLQTF